MAIDSALGRLGIKQGVCTSSTRPTNPFEGQVIYESDTNRTLVYDNAAWIVVADNQVLSIDAANGRVGIGTDTPEANLDINGNSPSLLFTSPTDTNRYRIDANISDVADYGMSLGYWDGAAYQRTLTVDATGKVGIKDTAPSYPLDVTGDINTTGSLRIGGTAIGEWTAFTPSWDFNGNAITTTGFNYGYYLVVGDLKIVRAGFRYSSSSGGGALRLVLPSAAGFTLAGIHTYTRDGYAHRYDASANANYLATPFYWNSGTVIGFYHEGGAANVTDTVPVTWGGNDEFFCTLIGSAP